MALTHALNELYDAANEGEASEDEEDGPLTPASEASGEDAFADVSVVGGGAAPVDCTGVGEPRDGMRTMVAAATTLDITIGTSQDISDSFARELYALINRAYGHQRVTIADVRNRLRQGDDALNRVLHLARRNGELVGCCSSTIQAPWCDDSCGHWGLLVVAPQAQDCGVGTALVRVAEARLRAHGCAHVQMEYYYTRGDAHAERLRAWYEGALDFSCETPSHGGGQAEGLRRCRKPLPPFDANEDGEDVAAAIGDGETSQVADGSRRGGRREGAASTKAVEVAAEPHAYLAVHEAATASALASAAAPPTSRLTTREGQVCCRFCLSEETRDAPLTYPCACTAPVHRRCLVLWQRQQERQAQGSLVCEVCHAAWGQPLAPTERECWLHRVGSDRRWTIGHSRGTTHMGEAALSSLSSVTHEQMDLHVAAGSLIVQSPFACAHNGRQMNACARAIRGDARALSLFAPATGGGGWADDASRHSDADGIHHETSDSQSAAAAHRAQRERLHLGCFLILHVDRAANGSSSDGMENRVVVAANLSRLHACQPSVPLGARAASAAQRQSVSVSLPPPQAADGALLISRPHPPDPEAPAANARGPNALRANAAGEAAQVRRPAELLEEELRAQLDAAAPSCGWRSRRLPILRGGQACLDEAPLCLVRLHDGWRGSLPLDEEFDLLPVALHGPISSALESLDGDFRGGTRCEHALRQHADDSDAVTAGRPPTRALLYVMEAAPAVRLASLGRVCGALVIEGVSLWSSQQLLTEVARGGWGICHGKLGDVPLPAEHGHSAQSTEDVSSARQADFVLWSSCWRERQPLAVEAQANPMML